MQVTETLNQGLKREFKVVVPAAALEKEMMTRLQDLAGRANLKGFRPGKVPVPHLKRIYGKSVMAEVVQAQVDEGSKKILEERKIKAAYQPEVKLPEDKDEVERIFDGKADFEYSMALEIVPEFELQDVSGIEIVRHIVDVEDRHIQEAMERIAAQVKNFAEKDGKAETGDRVTLSFVGRIDGKEFEGGKADDVPLEIGSGQFIPGFEDQLIGAKAGDDKIVKVTFPETYGVKTLAGKPAEFSVEVNKVEAIAPAAYDDDFAKRVGFESLDKLKEDFKGRIAAEYGRMTSMKLKRDVLDALDGAYKFDLPEKLVEAELNGIWKALTNEMAKAKKSFADEGTTEEDARKEYRSISERRVRLGLVLGTMGEKEGIKVADEEMQRALLDRARQFPGQEKQVIDFYRKNTGALIELRGPIFEQKVVDLIVSRAKVSDKPISRDELQKLVAEEDEDEHSGHDHAGHDHDHDHDHGHDHAHDHGDHDHSHDHAHETKPAPKKKAPAKKKAKPEA
jgi:trigger factor